ncbi:recombinase RecT [Microbispora amethystogenes]|uniref:recombinase RecT n=1 Tax=Microbispora amethystogenes TaxID=1427754 RepID=UPI0033CB4209
MGHNLADRAEQARGLAKQQPATLAQQISAMQTEFQRAMPKGAEAGQLVRDALTCLRATPKLANCFPASVLGGLMTCAQLGLRPGVAGLGHAWLLPMWNGSDKRLDATLIIGYRGYTELAYRHDKVVSIASRVVYSNDRFRLAYSLEGDVLEHEPYVDGPRGEPRLYYALAKLQGGYALTEPWTQADMLAHRDRYAMAKKKDGTIVGPWADPAQFVEMARKTMIRNPLVKMIPLSTELAMAVAVDEGVRLDLSPTVDPTEVTDHPVIEGQVEPDDEPSESDDDWPPVTRPGGGDQ